MKYDWGYWLFFLFAIIFVGIVPTFLMLIAIELAELVRQNEQPKK